MTRYLVIDQGGHATRALVFGADGELLLARERSLPLHRPESGFAELDPEALLASVRGAVADALRALGGALPLGAGIATQRSNCLWWRRTDGRALTPVMSWMDIRGAAQVRALAPAEAGIVRRTGLRLSPHYGASKLAWWLQRDPALARAARAGEAVAGPMAGFIARRLLEPALDRADVAHASRTQLLDRQVLAWDAGLCRDFGLPAAALPALAPCEAAFGELDTVAGAIPCRVITGDQSAALFGWGRPAQDTLIVNIGTGAFLQRVANPHDPVPEGTLRGIAFQDAAGRVFETDEATVNGAGSALQHWAQESGVDPGALPRRVATADAAAADPPLFLNGIGGLGAPWWVPAFRSRWEGEGDADARLLAVVESIAFLIAENVERLARTRALRRVLLAGGWSRSEALCRCIAALVPCTVVRSGLVEATGRGVAWWLAGSPEDWPRPAEEAIAARPDGGLPERYRRWRDAMRTEIERTRADTA